MQHDSLPARRSHRGRVAWNTGRAAEHLAEQALRAAGWTILLQRARTACGEIDLVARKAGHISFVEVKSRERLSAAACSLGQKQQQRIMAGAEILLAEHPAWQYDALSFDVILVDHAGTVRRIQDAFRIA